MPPRDLTGTPTLDPVEDISRRRLLTALPALGLLAAGVSCGDDEAAGPSGDTVTITSKYGTYDIPAEPKRLLLMGNRHDLETALALGLTPIAVGIEYAFSGGPAEYIAPWVPFTPAEDIETFPAGESTIEEMLALEPDLIFCQAYQMDNPESYRAFDRLKAVAPIVPTALLPWREDLTQVAGWLGREDNLAELFKEYDELRDRIKAKHASRLSTAKVAVGYPAQDNIFWLASTPTADTPTRDALSDLGGATIDIPDGTYPGWSELSFENLRELDQADALFVYNTDDLTREALINNPVWSLLDVVKNNRVVMTPNVLGTGSVYTRMECLRLWDEVYSTLA